MLQPDLELGQFRSQLARFKMSAKASLIRKGTIGGGNPASLQAEIQSYAHVIRTWIIQSMTLTLAKYYRQSYTLTDNQNYRTHK